MFEFSVNVGGKTPELPAKNGPYRRNVPRVGLVLFLLPPGFGADGRRCGLHLLENLLAGRPDEGRHTDTFLYSSRMPAESQAKIASLPPSYTKPHLHHPAPHLARKVCTEYAWEVSGYCQELEFSLCYPLPWLLLIVKLVFFTLSCVADPGTIAKADELLLLHADEFDAVMFPKNTRPSACDWGKPARPEPCGVRAQVCNIVSVWCTAAWARNARYFLAYLLTLMASAATVVTVSTACLVQLVVVPGDLC